MSQKTRFFKKKSDEIEHWKYKLEIGYIQKYQHDMTKKEVTFSLYISLEKRGIL